MAARRRPGLLVLDAVATLDLDKFRRGFRLTVMTGRRPAPEMMVALEPVFGQPRPARNDHDVPARPGRVRNEWLLACTAHNLRKLYRHRAEC